MSHFSALAPASSRTRCMRDVAGWWLAFLVLTIAAGIGLPHLPGRVTRTAALAEFYKADDDRQHRVGCSNYATNRGLVYTIEAARALCGGADDLALDLLRVEERFYFQQRAQVEWRPCGRKEHCRSSQTTSAQCASPQQAMRSPAGLMLQERLFPRAKIHVSFALTALCKNIQLNALDADCDVTGVFPASRRVWTAAGLMTRHPPNKPLRICSLVCGPSDISAKFVNQSRIG
jgi:hypothetical protein